MPSRQPKAKGQAQRGELASKATGSVAKDATTTPPKNDQIMRMPMTNYLSAVGMHTSLLAFSALYLPQSTLLQELPFPFEDVPQSLPHTPLEVVTARPTLTLFSLCLGAILLQTWWSNWLRNWWIDSMIEGGAEIKAREKKFFTRKRSMVRLFWDDWLFSWSNTGQRQCFACTVLCFSLHLVSMRY